MSWWNPFAEPQEAKSMADWRSLYTMTMGVSPKDTYLPAYSASLIFFIINLTIGCGLRAIVQRSSLPYKWKDVIVDFVCTMETCAYFFENNFVAKHYGLLWLALVIMVQLYVCNRTFGDNIDNPLKAFHLYLQGWLSIDEALIRMVVTTMAGLASYRLAQLIWSLDLIEDHHVRYYETTCGSDLQVMFLVGLMIELVASLSDTWLSHQTVSSNRQLDEFLKVLNPTFMIVIGLHTTGMYFNPAMATGHTLGCGNTKYWEHFVVYWLGPFIGTVLAFTIDNKLQLNMRPKGQDMEDECIGDADTLVREMVTKRKKKRE